MINERISQRFDELSEKFNSLPLQQSERGSIYHYKSIDWLSWATSAQHLIKSTFGENSIHSKNIDKFVEKCLGYQSDVEALFAVFLSAYEDYKGGYLFSVEQAISGEIFGDFVGMANAALANGHKNVAAVLAAAALEDSIKRFCISKDIDVQDKSLQDLVNAMKSKSLLSGSKKSLLDSMPRIRDNAMHANWDKITEVDIGAMIGFLNQFLLTEF